MTSDGGGVAAFGYRYQYLATAEEFLRVIAARTHSLNDVTLIVEPTRADVGSGSEADDDIVDFAIEIEGTITRRVQVKASRDPLNAKPLGYSDASTIFKRMGAGDAETVILTNKPQAAKLRKACAAPTATSDGKQQYVVTDEAITGGESNPIRAVVRDDRQLSDLKQSIFDLIQEIRRDKALGQGLSSAGLLAALVLDSIFESAAGSAPRRRAALEIESLLCTPDAQIAHALRHFDWGVPLAEVPRLVSAVARSAELTELTDLFTDSVKGRNPKAAILIGVTGFGKSTVAADFCHLNRHFYEHVFWIDCRTEGLIEAKFKDVIAQLGHDPSSVSDVAAAFRTGFARLGGPSVVVFDGVRRRQDIEKFVPTSGCGLTIVTTTNSTGWWHTAEEIQIASFTEEEAVACFEAYAQIEPGTHTMAVAAIVNRLGRVPLAIAMAALHFRNADEDLSQLSREYFASLDALADSTSVPEGFDRTAFAAVRHAVAQLGSGDDVAEEDKRATQALVYHSAFLAPELIPVNLLLQTVHETAVFDLTDPPVPEVADQGRRNRVLVNLRTQTIARRRRYLDSSDASNPASDTINIHPLVHEILRSIHRQLAPVERMVDLLTMLMACAYGWIIKFRREGAFFPLEQLLVHGQWVLDLVETVSLPEGTDQHQIYVFRCAKLYLSCEIANSAASRGEYERSVRLMEKALDDIQDIELSPHAQGAVTKAVCDMVADAALGGLDSDRARLHAKRALVELGKLSRVGGPRIGEVVATLALQTAHSIRNLGATDVEDLATQFTDMAARQQVTRMPTVGWVLQIERSLAGGLYREALVLIKQARNLDLNIYDKVMFDNFESIANLHLGRLTEASDAIERILRAAGTPHMHTHLTMACEEVGKALHATQHVWSGRSTVLTTQQHELQQLRATLA